MKIEEKLLSSHESLVEGISVLILKNLYEHQVIEADADVAPLLEKVTAEVEVWLSAEYHE